MIDQAEIFGLLAVHDRVVELSVFVEGIGAESHFPKPDIRMGRAYSVVGIDFDDYDIIHGSTLSCGVSGQKIINDNFLMRRTIAASKPGQQAGLAHVVMITTHGATIAQQHATQPTKNLLFRFGSG